MRIRSERLLSIRSKLRRLLNWVRNLRLWKEAKAHFVKTVMTNRPRKSRRAPVPVARLPLQIGYVTYLQIGWMTDSVMELALIMSSVVAEESLILMCTQVRAMPSGVWTLLKGAITLTVHSSVSVFLLDFYLLNIMISLGIILTGIGWSVVQCICRTLIMILSRTIRDGIRLLTVFVQRGGRNTVSAIESPHESLRQVQIRESVEAMAGSTIVVSNREFEIEGYTVKTSLLDTGTEEGFRSFTDRL